jgi:AcrR family transcriptional regulator
VSTAEKTPGRGQVKDLGLTKLTNWLVSLYEQNGFPRAPEQIQETGTQTGRAATVGDQTLEESLFAVAEFHHDLMRRYPEFRSVLMRELAHPREEILSYIFDIFEASGLPGSLLARFSEEMEAGHIKRTDPRQLLISFLTMNLGYVMLAPLFDRIMGISDRELFVEERKQEVVKLFLNGILSRKKRSGKP